MEDIQYYWPTAKCYLFHFKQLFLLFVFKIPLLSWTQNPNKTPIANESMQETEEDSHDMNPLLKNPDQEAGRSEVAKETLPDSVESKT